MAANQIIAEAYADAFEITDLTETRDAALEVYTNSATVSRSCEGMSLTIDKSNAESVLENVQEALRIKRAKGQGCDAELSRPSLATAVDWRQRRIF